MTTIKAKKAIGKLTRAASDWRNERDAWLGRDLVSRAVETGTPGLLWARMENGKPVKVHNTVGVSADYDLHIKIGENRHQRKMWQIIRKVEDYDIPAGGGRVAYHHDQHEFLGPDEVRVNRKQIMQLTVRVADSAGFIVALYGDAAVTPSGLVQINNQYVDLSAEVVTVGAKFVNIETDDAGAISLNAGTVFDAPAIATINDVPTPDPGKYLIAYVLMYEGQTGLLDEHIHVPMPLGMPNITIIPSDTDPEPVDTVAADPGVSAEYSRKDHVHLYTGSSSTDTDAVHVNVDGEIDGLTEKTTPIAGDFIVIEDSEDGFAKKKADIGNLPGGGGGVSWSQVVDENGSSFANFTGVAGTWSSDGTVIKQTDTAAAGRRAKFSTKILIAFLVYEGEVQIKSSGSARVGGLIMGFDGTANGSTEIILDEGADVIKVQVSGITDLLTVSTTINVDTWYKIRAIFNGGVVSVYLDDVFLGSCGNTPNRTNDAHFIGLSSYQAEVWYRNVKAWVLTLP